MSFEGNFECSLGREREKLETSIYRKKIGKEDPREQNLSEIKQKNLVILEQEKKNWFKKVYSFEI